MSVSSFEALHQALVDDPTNAAMRERGWQPVYAASANARVAVVSHAPGRKAQTSAVPWDDASGRTLIDWLGVTQAQFRSPHLFAQLPMDFYYPGRGASGDLPPRKGFAERWHAPLLDLMPHVGLVLLVGRHAQLHYLPSGRHRTLTDTVRDYQYFLPERFPLVHPSPLNFRWHAKNPWFVTDVVPHLRARIQDALGDSAA